MREAPGRGRRALWTGTGKAGEGDRQGRGRGSAGPEKGTGKAGEGDRRGPGGRPAKPGGKGLRRSISRRVVPGRYDPYSCARSGMAPQPPSVRRDRCQTSV
ncbi:hypothetical protein GCM10010104_40400 [Streptomyces indiaensis]|uniref:Uncharacterized protein n=1 Tax=Streptomyces indiaensis TaxID=284033 RepID=A0ABN3DSQ2_9ACTN